MAKKRLQSWLLEATLLMILCASVGGVIGCSPSDSSSSPEELGLIPLEVAAQDFTLPTMAGTEVTLSELQGMPVLLNFWHRGCAPCLAELHYFDALARQYPDTMTIVAVDIQDSLAQIKEFFSDSEIAFIVALGKNTGVASSYAIRYTPTTFFIDSEGIIRYVKVGAFASKEELQASTDELLQY
jgi:thiol-disulfide isomerase/thioredoxin